MPKITRPDTNVQGFGTTTDGTGRTIYGSEIQSDDLTDNLSAAYLKGWNTIGQKPPRQWFNGAMFTTSQLVSYLFQVGIAEWNVNQEYYTNSKCTSPIDGLTYVSKTGTAPSTPNPGTTDPSLDSTNWKTEVTPSLTPIIKSTAYTALPNDFISVDTTTGVVPITLPPTPVNNTKVKFHDVKSNFHVNRLEILRNGETIMGIADDTFSENKGDTFTMQFIDNDWRVLR